LKPSIPRCFIEATQLLLLIFQSRPVAPSTGAFGGNGPKGGGMDSARRPRDMDIPSVDPAESEERRGLSRLPGALSFGYFSFG
jgi:hypothetical protein